MKVVKEKNGDISVIDDGNDLVLDLINLVKIITMIF